LSKLSQPIETMRNKLLFSLFFLSFFNVGNSVAQQFTQSIRGQAKDAMSGSPVSFATVAVLHTDPVIGTTTDVDGHFLLRNVPVGRHDIQISFIGYESTIIKEVVVTSAKEVFLDVVMRESVTNLNEVIVRPSISKEEPINTMATVSARMLSVDEASRYAGGFDDPARLASAFAGVASNVGNNGIVIRGNAPRMMQWKMEGVEIPNPNHFADLGTFGGGGLTALSSNLLANSDFFTGAFPAEYNNALSGVFDIFMRKGNPNEHSHSFQIGLIGIDASSEGPFKTGGKSSYLFNYRYSTLALMQPLLPNDAEGISYQDLSFKLNFPTEKAGTFSLWGIGLIDRSGQTAKTDPTEWKYMQDKEEGSPRQFMGASGLSHLFQFNNSTTVRTTLASTASELDWKMNRMNENLVLLPHSEIQNTNWNLVLNSVINKKFSSKHTNRTGMSLTGLGYNLTLKDAGNTGGNPVTILDNNGFTSLLSAFSGSSFQLAPRISFNVGINGQIFTLNNNYTIEPRVGTKWLVSEKSSLSLAYGLHSRLERIHFYLTESTLTKEQVNRNLDFSKSHHFVLGYDYRISDNMVLKLEPYYQALFNIPVIPNTSFSFINLQNEWFFNDQLENSGRGRNYGIDLTLEKYLSKGYYYMITASLFRSEYLGGDGIWRNTAFDRKFLINILGGKEWEMGKSKQNVFGLNIRSSIQGGDTYTPINERASLLSQSVIYDQTKAFSLQNTPLFVFHFTASYKINKQNTSKEIALKIINATAQNDFMGFRYNYQTQKIDKHLEAIVIPNLSYKITF
jgi:hypothetical protein